MKRAFALMALAAAGVCPVVAGTAQQPIYRYTNQAGRVVYTNIADDVPLDQRGAARVDLSRVSVNAAIGNELNARLAEEHRALAASPYCRELEHAAAKPELQRLWDEHPVPITCGAILAALILLTPKMLRSVHPPAWARVLSKVLPALLVVGGVMWGMQTAQRQVAALRARLEPCLSETFQGLSSRPDAAAKQLGLIDQLKRDIAAYQAAAAQRTADLEDLVGAR